MEWSGHHFAREVMQTPRSSLSFPLPYITCVLDRLIPYYIFNSILQFPPKSTLYFAYGIHDYTCKRCNVSMEYGKWPLLWKIRLLRKFRALPPYHACQTPILRRNCYVRTRNFRISNRIDLSVSIIHIRLILLYKKPVHYFSYFLKDK